MKPPHTQTAPLHHAGYALQTRLLTWVLGAVGVVWAGVIFATWSDAEHEIGELLDAHLSQAAALLVSQPLDDLSDLARHETPVLHEYQPKVVLQVWHLDELVVRSATAPMQALAQHQQRGFSQIQISGEQWRVFSAQGKDHHVVIHVAEQDKARTDVIWASLRSVIWPMAIAFPLLGLVIWWAVRRAVRPLRELSQQVREHQPDTAQTLALNTAPQEIQPVVQELNRLFARTAQLIEAERRFTADAAHELRTPIAAIRMQAQVAQGAGDALERQTALAATVQGCDRATRLVEQLLQLARLESQTQVEQVRVSAWTCAQVVLADLQYWAQQRQQRLHLQGSPDALTPVPEALATVLLRNLVDNALRYSPIGADIRITVQPGLYGVEDSGAGLSEAEIARLGERFFRVLGSGQPGSGLGWSIVTRIARLYGLQWHIGRSPELGGLAVWMKWSP
jgi:two-component system sensor histidine kinase QseC